MVCFFFWQHDRHIIPDLPCVTDIVVVVVVGYIILVFISN